MKTIPLNQQQPQRLTILGSTGSIGVNTLDVVRKNPGHYSVQYLTTYRQIDRLLEQIEEFRPKAVAVLDPEKADELRKMVNRSTDVLVGEEGLMQIASRDDIDTIVGAMVGFSGLRPTLEAIKKGKRICIANKETLVVAGELVTALAKRTGSEIIPIDSEHSAIAQCLVGEEAASIKRIILTASGGPFRTRDRETFEGIKVEDALKHPNWVMGQKITIDSASLMNKGLEVIEARWLFDLPLEKIDVIVHPQSIVHSFVEFVDGSVKAQLGAPDMRLPIQYALDYPKRLARSYELLDLLSQKALEFYAPDLEKFPCLRLAKEALEQGGLYPCILNAANEVAVDAFLNRKIRFTDIPVLIERTMKQAPADAGNSFDSSTEQRIEQELDRVFKTDNLTRQTVQAMIEKEMAPIL